jgi:hypothetical protein
MTIRLQESRAAGMARLRLTREIGAVLLAKLVLLCALYFAFFDSDHRPASGADATTAQVLGAAKR